MTLTLNKGDHWFIYFIDTPKVNYTKEKLKIKKYVTIGGLIAFHDLFQATCLKINRISAQIKKWHKKFWNYKKIANSLFFQNLISSKTLNSIDDMAIQLSACEVSADRNSVNKH